MRAWAVVEPGKPLQELELPTPEPEGEQVLLEVVHCGVCHSDLHIWEGHYDLGSAGKLDILQRGVKLPVAMGHEIIGRVSKLGPRAKGVAVGDLRIVYPWIGCGECHQCKSGDDNLCMIQKSLGVFQNGGYATHVLAARPAHLVDPKGVDPAIAATYACSGITVYSAIKKVMPLPKDVPIVLIGAGGLGLAAVAILKALGHEKIVSVDVSAEKREAARAAGASDTVDGAAADVPKAIAEACGGPPEAIIDLVNGSATALAAYQALRKGGKLIMVGLFGGELKLPLPFIPIRALTIRGSYVGNPGDLRELIDLAGTGKLLPVPYEKVPLNKANDALMRLKSGKVTGRLVLTADTA